MIDEPCLEGPATSMDNGTTTAPSRTGTIHRVTGETDVRVNLSLDGSGQCQVTTGVPFLEHRLHQISSHGLFDLEIRAVFGVSTCFVRSPGLDRTNIDNASLSSLSSACCCVPFCLWREFINNI